MMHKIKKWLVLAVVFSGAITFVVLFAGPRLIKAYIETGIGNCKNIPILCMEPQAEVIFETDKNYTQELVPYKFPKIEIYAPKGFNVVQELIKKYYYKKKKLINNIPVIYLLHEPPNYFVKLFPQIKKLGINDNYFFLRRLMFAQEFNINNLNDAFFIIMKGIFIPNIGNQNTAKMTQFKIGDKIGFLNYNLSKTGNYFDASFVDGSGAFFKVYIKDKKSSLDLNKAITIISTAHSNL